MGIGRRATITAGVDGSAESLTAARWAAAEAIRRHTALELLLAVQEPVDHHSAYVFPDPVIQAMRAAGRARLDDAADLIRRDHPDLDVRVALERGDPRRALVTRSRQSLLTVVGTQGHGRLPEVLMGSVALYVSAHAHSPVAAVPPTVAAASLHADRPVLVGVSGRPDSTAAVGFAFDEAAVRAVPLRAVLVFDELAYRGFAKGGALIGELDDGEEHAVLSEELAGWREKYPDVRVEQSVLRGRPAESLLGYGRDGREDDRPGLVVLGTRGRGGLAGLLLGSTSHRVMTHSDVPVVVVPPDDDI